MAHSLTKKKANHYMVEVAKQFNKGVNFNYIYLDAWMDKENADDDEKECFAKSKDKLWGILNNSKKLETAKVKKIQNENEALKRMIAEKEKERTETGEELEEERKRREEERKRRDREIEEEERKVRATGPTAWAEGGKAGATVGRCLLYLELYISSP